MSPSPEQSNPETERRSFAASFLRARRLQLKPADVGLPDGTGRRVSGLRREEVAALAGIGTTWYTWLEQGRQITISSATLERVADALRLTPDEREYLRTLVVHREQDDSAAWNPRGISVVEHVVRTQKTEPVLAYSPRADLMHSNALYDELMQVSKWKGPHTRNFYWFFFTNPIAKYVYVDWEAHAARLVPIFRFNAARQIGDPDFILLIEDLRSASDVFARYWEEGAVASARHVNHLHLRDPDGRARMYEIIRLAVPEAPGIFLGMLVPH